MNEIEKLLNGREYTKECYEDFTEYNLSGEAEITIIVYRDTSIRVLIDTNEDRGLEIIRDILG